MKRRTVLIALLSLSLFLLSWAVIKPAYAYFTTYTQTKGGYTVSLQSQTTIEESFKEGVKSVTVTNKEGMPVFVRVRAFAGAAYPLTYPTTKGWTFVPDEGSTTEGWWTYDTPIAAGAKTDVLDVKINDIPEKAEIDDSFNVIVVYESTPALYDADGNAYADWTKIMDNVSEGGGE